MKELKNKDRVNITVQLIKQFCHTDNYAVRVMKKEACGDVEIIAHKTAFSEIYKLADALRVTVVLIEQSAFSEGFYRISIC